MTDEFKEFDSRLNLKGRRSLYVSGVEDVSAFDEKTVLALTDMGELTVKGEELKILSLDTETGEMKLEGADISSLVYTAAKYEGGFFKRLFK